MTTTIMIIMAKTKTILSAKTTVSHGDIKVTVRKGPSISDVHTERGRGQAQVIACGRRSGVKPHVDVHTEN